MSNKLCRNLISVIILSCLLLANLPLASARSKGQANIKPAPVTTLSKGKILFVPQDDRPTSCEQTAAVVKAMGYEVVTPDKSILGSLTHSGDTEALWQWTQKNAKDAKAAVIAVDSLLYGGLVNSRKHEIPEAELQSRATRVKLLREQNPQMKLYAFGSLMRTPHSGAASGGEDPDYYVTYGSQFFRYTGLMDKAETVGLTSDEEAECTQIESIVPPEIMTDWFDRRQHNLAATMRLTDDVRRGAIDYLLIGKDDNAPLSETHRESRWLLNYAHGIPSDRFRLVAGIDEFAMLLMTRAVNDIEQLTPKVCTLFNEGKGGDTIPTYSDEKLSETLKTELSVAGALAVATPAEADYVLLVNTNPSGATGEANHVRPGEGKLLNDGKDRPGTQYFLNLLQSMLQAGYKVGIADIAFTNGSDNALMNHLKNNEWLFSLRAYSGWNTATNSLGFALGQGILAARLTQQQCEPLLRTRYFDDWLYQANVRTEIGHRMEKSADPSVYLYLGQQESTVAEETAQSLSDIAKKNLPADQQPSDITVSFPWHRMFIADIEAK